MAVVDRVRHAKYNKFVLRTKKLHAHDEKNDCKVGDVVTVRAPAGERDFEIVDVQYV